MSYRGTYKGSRFRSLLELSFYKHLEGAGVGIGEIGYEVVRIPYRSGRRVRTYVPDFLVGRRLYEVKPARRQRGRAFAAKVAAGLSHAARYGMEYLVVSEDDFEVLSLGEALEDPDVVIVIRRRRRRR